jgi:hypothetical protein
VVFNVTFNNVSVISCAVAVPAEEGEEPKIFHSFCKVLNSKLKRL